MPSELSASACGGDAIRFSQIKMEVIEMIKFRNPSMETKVEKISAAVVLHAFNFIYYISNI